MNLILAEIKEKVGILTLNNPERRNALSLELCDELSKALEDMKNKKVPVIIIRAARDVKVWSAGHDINQLPELSKDPLPYDSPMEKSLRAIQEYPGAVIAMVQGGVWGGATDIVVTCDIVVGDETATFAITPVKIGLPYNASGITHFINRVGINIAKEMFFTAQPVKAERAYHFGILNHIISSRDLEQFTFELAKIISGNSPLAIAVIKEQFRLLSESHPLSADTFERIQALRRKVYSSHDYEEGIKAFLDKRKPEFRGE